MRRNPFTVLAFSALSLSLMTSCGDDKDDKKEGTTPTPSLSAEEIRELSAPSSTQSVAISPDGNFVVTGGRNGMVQVFNRESGEEVHSIAAHDDGITQIVFRRDGNQFLTSSYDRTAKLWDMQNARELKTYHSNHAFSDVALSPDDSHFLSGHPEGWIRVWNIETEKAEHAIEMGPTAVSPAHAVSPVQTVAYSNDSNRVFVGTSRGLRFFSVANKTEVRNYKFGEDAEIGGVSKIAISPDGGRVLAIAKNNRVLVWEVESGKELRAFDKAVVRPQAAEQWERISAAFFAGGSDQIVALVDHEMFVWDINSGTEIASMALSDADMRLSDFAISKDGRFVVTAQDNGTAKVWQLNGGEMIALR